MVDARIRAAVKASKRRVWLLIIGLGLPVLGGVLALVSP